MNNKHLIDMDEVERRIDQAFADANLTRTKATGEVVRDEDEMKRRVLDLVTSKKVPDRHGRSKNSLTQGELYAAVFPGAPGTDPPKGLDDLDLNEREVRSKLMRKVWNLTNPGIQGYVQKRLGANGGSLVLCRGRVMRGLDEVAGVYVTDDADVILADAVQPQIESLVRQANNLRQHVEMIGVRHPELEPQMTAAIGTGLDRTRAALPRAASAPNGNAPADSTGAPVTEDDS